MAWELRDGSAPATFRVFSNAGGKGPDPEKRDRISLTPRRTLRGVFFCPASSRPNVLWPAAASLRVAYPGRACTARAVDLLAARGFAPPFGVAVYEGGGMATAVAFRQDDTVATKPHG